MCMTWGTLYSERRCREQKHLAIVPPPLRAKVWKEDRERRDKRNVCDDEDLLKACPWILAPGWSLGNCRDGEPLTYNGITSVPGMCLWCQHEKDREDREKLKERQKKNSKKWYDKDVERRKKNHKEANARYAPKRKARAEAAKK